jgi:hypothetical protein
VSAEGLPPTPVRLWVSGDSWQAACEHVVLADDDGRDDGQDHQGTDMHGGSAVLKRLAELGLRAIEVLRRLDTIDDGSPITDASEEVEAVLNDAAASVAEAQGAGEGDS